MITGKHKNYCRQLCRKFNYCVHKINSYGHFFAFFNFFDRKIDSYGHFLEDFVFFVYKNDSHGHFC